MRPTPLAAYARRAAMATVALAVLVVVLFGLAAATKAFQRYQARADAANAVSVTATQIRNYEQRAKIEQQKAHIRQIQAIGIREAQDEISRTLTPLYVQFEMVQALQQIAQSGRNNTTIFIPNGAGGIPLVQGTGASVGQAGK